MDVLLSNNLHCEMTICPVTTEEVPEILCISCKKIVLKFNTTSMAICQVAAALKAELNHSSGVKYNACGQANKVSNLV